MDILKPVAIVYLENICEFLCHSADKTTYGRATAGERAGEAGELRQLGQWKTILADKCSKTMPFHTLR